jgi:hypothetical protein
MVALRGDEILDGRTAGMALELASLLVQPLQGSEPKGIGEPPLQLVTPIVMHDGLRHHGAKARHPVGRPARNMPAVQPTNRRFRPGLARVSVPCGFRSDRDPFMFCATRWWVGATGFRPAVQQSEGSHTRTLRCRFVLVFISVAWRNRRPGRIVDRLQGKLAARRGHSILERSLRTGAVERERG